MKVSVITVSDRAYQGVYKDLSGPEIVKHIKESYPKAKIQCKIVPDDKNLIKEALKSSLGDDWVITTGGTGLSDRDITPEVTQDLCVKGLPGISEALRFESYKETPMSLLSRAYSGFCGHTIFVNFPGSVKGARCCIKVLLPVMDHSILMFKGEGH